MIEGHDTVDFGPRAVERSRHQRFRSLVDVAEFVLQGVQDRQQRPIQVQQLLDALLGQIGVPRRSPGDLSTLPENPHI